MKKKIKKIPLSEPAFFGEEIKYIKNCVKSGWITTSGKYLNLFESKVKKITKSKYAVSLANGTSALQLSLSCLKPMYKDEVIVPSITFVATINAVKYNNCSPIFMDSDENFLIDKNKTLEFLKKNTYKKNGFTYNKKTKKRIIAIIIVHTFGNCVNLTKKIVSTFKNYNIKIIEDAAESFGSFFKEKKLISHSGTKGDIGCFSFNGNKIITSGGGGMIVTKNRNYYKKIFYLSTQAKNDPINFIHNEVGYNLRMTNLHAAIGLSQIKHLKKIINKRKKIHKAYLKNINPIPGLKLLRQTKNSFSNFWLNVLKVDESKFGSSKTKLIKHLLSKGIEVRSVWFPNHLQKPFIKNESYKIKNSHKLFKKSLCLPSSYTLSNKQLMFIIKLLKNYAKKS